MRKLQERDRLSLALMFLAFLIILWFAASSIRRAQGSEFEFLLILEQLRQEETQQEPAPQFTWSNYKELRDTDFPNGAIVFVSAPKCPPCELLKKFVFTDAVFQEELAHLVWTQAPVSKWAEFQGQYKALYPPFLVSVAPGGGMQDWVKCPIVYQDEKLDVEASVNAWLSIFKPKQEDE